MNKLLWIIFLLFFFSRQGIAQSDNLIIIGKKDSIYSEVLEEQRGLLIYLPETFKSNPKAKYPVIYLLDGEGYFHSLAGIVKQLSSFGTTVCPETIIVGIPNTERYRDLMPPDPADSLRHLNGGEKFTSFLEKELIPFIDNKYPALPYRTLVGHSLGGSFVINTLMRHQNLFTNYLAIDPGLKSHEYRFLEQSIIDIKKGKFVDKSLYVALANTMPMGMDTLSAMKDTSWVTSTFRSNYKFAKSITGFSDNGLNYVWKYYPDESHLSIPIIAEYDAINFFFSWHSIDLDKIIRTNPDMSGKMFLNKVVDHFENVSERLSYAVLPTEEMINDIGFYYYEKSKFEDSYIFFEHNLKLYPASAEANFSMGEWYAAQSLQDKAIEYYNKSLEIDEKSPAKEKLQELKMNKH